MYCIVPIAGDDFVSPSGEIKGLLNINNQPLLKYVLYSRPWHKKVSQYIFILRDSTVARNFTCNYLTNWFANCTYAYLTSQTSGAVCTTLAGLSMVKHMESPIIVDLADIYFKSSIDIQDYFLANRNIEALALTFKSCIPCYSYFLMDGLGSSFIRSAEKEVISDNASAGVYIYRNASILLSAMSCAFGAPSEHMHKGSFYISTLFNGLKTIGLNSAIHAVTSIDDIKITSNYSIRN